MLRVESLRVGSTQLTSGSEKPMKSLLYSPRADKQVILIVLRKDKHCSSVSQKVLSFSHHFLQKKENFFLFKPPYPLQTEI